MATVLDAINARLEKAEAEERISARAPRLPFDPLALPWEERVVERPRGYSRPVVSTALED